MPERLEPLAVSILYEALRNAEKHADPSEVRVTIDAPDGAFSMEVRNDGLPPAGAGGGGGSGMGLRLASYEALQRGGMLEYGREEDRWRVRLVLPSSERRRQAERAGGRRPRRRPVGLQGAARAPAVGWALRRRLDAEEAGLAAASGKPHVALVDLFLGERSGRGALRGAQRGLAEDPGAADLRRRLDFAGGGQGRRRLGFISKDWSADEVANAVRMVGRGMTVYARQAEGPATPLCRASARSSS